MSLTNTSKFKQLYVSELQREDYLFTVLGDSAKSKEEKDTPLMESCDNELMDIMLGLIATGKSVPQHIDGEGRMTVLQVLCCI